MPWVRAVATRRARPALASQAEIAKRKRGKAEELVDPMLKLQIEKATYRESIMPSRHKSADRRCVRWNTRPVSPRMNAEEKVNWTGVIR